MITCDPVPKSAPRAKSWTPKPVDMSVDNACRGGVRRCSESIRCQLGGQNNHNRDWSGQRCVDVQRSGAVMAPGATTGATLRCDQVARR